MNIGIVCEGSETDKPVLELILKHKFPNTTFKIIARDKKAIFSACYEDIATLQQAGMHHIVVVWDLLPVGQQMSVASQWSEKPSRKEQREVFLRSLDTEQNQHVEVRMAARSLLLNYGFADGSDVGTTTISIKLKLICVCYALDGWLLSDERVIRQLGSTNAHQMELNSGLEHPDRCTNPAGLLTRLFRSAPNKRFRFYNKHQHNGDMVRAYIDQGRLDSLNTSSSYQRLIDVLQGWGAS